MQQARNQLLARIIVHTDALKAGGTTAMFDGLMNALKEIVTNGKDSSDRLHIVYSLSCHNNIIVLYNILESSLL